MIPYKIDTGRDGNIMPIHIFRTLFPKAPKEQLAAKNESIVLKTYNKTMT